MKRISPEVVDQIKLLLPELRKEVKKDFTFWKNYSIDDAFYSDDAILALIPYCVYEYYELTKGLTILDEELLFSLLNGGIFLDIQKITAHALRRFIEVEGKPTRYRFA